MAQKNNHSKVYEIEKIFYYQRLSDSFSSKSNYLLAVIKINGANMKKSFLFIAVLLSVVLLNTAVYSQLFQIGAGGGATFILAPSDYTSDKIDEGLNFGTGINFGVKAKLGLPLISFRPTFQVLFHKFSGEATSSISSQVLSGTTKQDILIVGAGLEYLFIPAPGSPFLALDLYYTNVGELSINDALNTVKAPDGSKVGIGVGIGTDIPLLPINIELSLKYNMFNLFGKEDGEKSISAINLDAFLMFSFL